MKRRIQKTCERCEQAFICGLYGCWCSEMRVSEAHYSEIIAKFGDCLCPSCLAQITGTPLPDSKILFLSQVDPSQHP